MMTAMIGLTVAAHPLQTLLAVIAIYHAGAEILGRRSDGRNRPLKENPRLQFRPAA
jgi:hypothetical protein